ncbi:hypothetical protein C8A01DRAFT_18092 [Parachaetomium inaequale]|uniref:NACHT domain-containing protein n=1 Tax=Parachaetomium inaequale TaxID=2588326 RepID=A0AAN6SPV2_9PEZI|nr:hypothetical protein C8A01DRAFT_18092 [Parachaetomium inaequale]
MAEVAGLALGVVGLAGIVGAFKDVVDLFSLFVDSKHLGRDYEILDTKLDIEKTMLLLWADRVGLLRPDYDRRLDLPNTQETVFRLNALVPATSAPGIIQDDLQPTQDLRGLKIVLEESAGVGEHAIADAAQEAIDRKFQDRILEMLWFRTMTAREEEIKPAHAKTLDWALEPPEGKGQWHDMSKWLRSGEGMYWVSGKAGSGKSTLMKRLSRHRRTRELLTEWASGGPCNLVSFFFWSLGTLEQKTQEGLSRSLLHQILTRHPPLIREALPGMWKELSRTGKDVDLPSLTEARHAFRVLASKASELGKFCFLIDGLDEFSGDYQNAIAFIKELTSNPGLKAIVSSRPIPECVAAFEDNPRLELHNLTKDDITTYVWDIIGRHKYMERLIKRSRYVFQAQGLMDDIIHKSSGVFLWVVLACQSLLSGFADYDQVDDLRRRVQELPPELEDMFKHMLGKVNKRHKEQGAYILRVCHAISTNLYFPINNMNLRIDALPVALICGDHVDVQPLSTDEKHDICDGLRGWLTSRCGGLLELHLAPRDRNFRHYRCYCRGFSFNHDLLVDSNVVWVHRSVVEFLNTDDAWNLECLHVNEGRPGTSAVLSLYSLHLVMQSQPHGSFFGSYRLFSYTLRFGARADAEEPTRHDNCFWGMAPYLDWIRRSERTRFPQFRALREIIARHSEVSQGISHALLLLAVESGAANYVKAHPDFARLFCAGVKSPCGCLPLLYHATDHRLLRAILEDVPLWWPTPSRAVVSLLLASGDSPNKTVTLPSSPGCDGEQEYINTTPWRCWLGRNRAPPRIGAGDRALVADITAMFLAAGADQTQKVPDWILRFLSDQDMWDRLTIPREQLLQVVEILQEKEILQEEEVYVSGDS